MSLDNSPGGPPFHLKSEELDPSLFQAVWAGTSHLRVFDPAQGDCAFSPTLMSAPSFEPRPYPPPSLAGVPMEYVLEQLRNLAPYYWKRPETADCTIVIPVPQSQGRLIPPSLIGLFPLQSESFHGMLHSSGRGRRATQPATNFVPQISFKLHVDYLSAHSSYLRGLFSGANPLGLVQSQIHSTPPPSPPGSRPGSRSAFNVPENRLPRLLPSRPQHPVLYLPVPDPSSFHVLIHWIYFGQTDPINDCLHQNVVQWEGIARNVEYLGLSSEIKLFLRAWYNRWVDRVRGDSDTLFSDTDDAIEGDGHPASACSSHSGLDTGDDYKGEDHRGRSRVSRSLSSQNLRLRDTGGNTF